MQDLDGLSRLAFDNTDMMLGAFRLVLSTLRVLLSVLRGIGYITDRGLGVVTDEEESNQSRKKQAEDCQDDDLRGTKRRVRFHGVEATGSGTLVPASRSVRRWAWFAHLGTGMMWMRLSKGLNSLMKS